MIDLGRSSVWMLSLAATLCGCSTAGSTWMAETPPDADDSDWEPEDFHGSFKGAPQLGSSESSSGKRATVVIDFPGRVLTIGGEPPASRPPGEAWDGEVLGTFRNTYYDFPNEAEHRGEPVFLRGPDCDAIAKVPRGFYEAVCVQGSGRLSSGQTVSFNRRDCSCADVCPRTNQRICFDALSMEKFPWGRGATGKPITPLLTIAVDPDVIPLNTAVYIPQYDGLPRDLAEASLHDGCFIAQDRGLKVVGKHVDIFTGQPALTALWNKLVPSNQGVTIVAQSRRCSKAGVITSD